MSAQFRTVRRVPGQRRGNSEDLATPRIASAARLTAMSASSVAFGAPKSPADRKRRPARSPATRRPHPALARLALPVARAGLAAPRRPPPALARLALLVAGAGLGAPLAVTIPSQPASQLSARGGALTYTGSLAGMIGTYLALIM